MPHSGTSYFPGFDAFTPGCIEHVQWRIPLDSAVAHGAGRSPGAAASEFVSNDHDSCGRTLSREPPARWPESRSEDQCQAYDRCDNDHDFGGPQQYSSRADPLRHRTKPPP